MKIHISSFIQAGTAGAVIAGLLLMLSLTPFFDNVLPILLVGGAMIIPICAGVYYGHLAPGEETMRQSIVGGALSGMVSGIILGVAFGLNAFMRDLASGIFGYAVVEGLIVTIISGVLLGVLGLLLGGLGGVIWKAVQKPEAEESLSQEVTN